MVSYCELWLEMKGQLKEFRVALLAPEGEELPVGFVENEFQNMLPEKKLYVSQWFDGIAAAKKAMNNAAQFYTDRDIKFLFFREIRKPQGEQPPGYV